MTDLTDQEKSVLLAKAMGWDTENMTDTVAMIDTPEGKPFFSFYNPANMALAWRVLNWACDHENIYLWNVYNYLADDVEIFDHSPDNAQRLWLDKIFELAVEAGIIEVEESIHG